MDKQSLKQLIDDPKKTLRLFGLGALLFVVGMGIIQWGNQLMEPSIEQEVTVLCGLIVGGAGFVTAITAQILLIFSRFQNMGK